MAAQQTRAQERQTKQAKAKAEEAKAKAAAEGNGQPERDFRKEADELVGDDYEGRLTHGHLRALEPLLYAPLPAKYIENTPPGDGHPYEMTGVKSAQVQLDRLTDVLGSQHYRVLTHYRENGTICKVVVIVGNDLQWARLDEQGQLQPFTVCHAAGANGALAPLKEAEVLVERSGWGGWKRGSNPGDVWKGAETNALKRTLARVGPGHEVYSQDFEDDPTRPEYEGAGQPAPSGQPDQPKLDEAEAATMLTDLLDDEEQPNHKLLQEANELMDGLPDPPDAVVRWGMLSPRANDEAQLQALINRAKAAQQEGAAEDA